jgi:hypothetical protein
VDDELRVGDDLELVHVERAGLAEALDKCSILGDVVRRHPDHFAVRREHGSVLRLEHIRVGGRARVAARATVGGEPRLHRSA